MVRFQRVTASEEISPSECTLAPFAVTITKFNFLSIVYPSLFISLLVMMLAAAPLSMTTEMLFPFTFILQRAAVVVVVSLLEA